MTELSPKNDSVDWSAEGSSVLSELPADARCCLFIDVDGTLLDIAPAPDEVQVPPELPQLLQQLSGSLDGALALISGRSIATLDKLFAPLQLPAAGVHGSERRGADGRIARSDQVTHELEWARETLAALLASRSDLLLEDKVTALALHFRKAPQAREFAELAVAKVMTRLTPEFNLLEGDKVLEIKPASRNKATAINAFMQEAPFAGRTAIFIGDDVTDFDGFAAVRQLGGIDIAVGDRVSARWHLSGPAAVRQWLRRLADRLSARK